MCAYEPPDGPGIDESARLHVPAEPEVTEVTPETYGPLKVACEQVAHARDARLTVTRPSYIVGPLDPTGRFSWWGDRVRRGGDVLVPGPADAPLQLIDGTGPGRLPPPPARDRGHRVFHVADQSTWPLWHPDRADHGLMQVSTPPVPVTRA